MKKLLVFGGTSEEHRLIQALGPLDVHVTLSVASSYGKALSPEGVPNLAVREGRLDQREMVALMAAEGFVCAVDATHPYATEVTANIKAAAEQAGIPYIRLLRTESSLEGTQVVASASEAASLLNSTAGPVLLTTGSKELGVFTAVENYKTRLYPRVLPSLESLELCFSNGYQPSRVIAMQGPFSQELNMALLRQFGIKTLVTKDGGKEGGFPEKLAAAKALGIQVIVIRRPGDNGLSLDAVVDQIQKVLEASQ